MKKIIVKIAAVLMAGVLFALPGVSALENSTADESGVAFAAAESVGDSMVYATQVWLNTTYGISHTADVYNPLNCYTTVEENGRTGSATMKALATALQIELGVAIDQSSAGSFGNQTMTKFNALPDLRKQTAGSAGKAIYTILQGALWCKGYGTGSYTLTSNFYDGTEGAVIKMQTDAGMVADGIVTGKIMKALLTTDAYMLVKGGNATIRRLQQELNRKYSDSVPSGTTTAFGIMPCDGIFSGAANKALIYDLQMAEGMSTSIANGNFGPATKAGCPLLNQDTAHSKKDFVRILQYTLLWNGYNPGRFDGEYGPEFVDAVKRFQEFQRLPQTGVVDVSTWAALFISHGDKMRKGNAMDCATILDAAKAQRLKQMGLQYVGRYLTGTVGGTASKAMTSAEIDAVLGAGLNIFPIYQDGATSKAYFTAAQGEGDAAKAFTAAQNLRIPEGTAIYFAVDYDFMDAEVTSRILPYFQSVYDYFLTNNVPYAIGIYGSRNMCTRVGNAGYTSYSFVSSMSSGFSGNIGYPMPSNWAFDQYANSAQADANPVYQSLVSFQIDIDMASGRDQGFSAADMSAGSLPSVSSVTQRYDDAPALYSGSAPERNTLYMNQGHTIADIVSQYQTMAQGFSYGSPYQTAPSLIPVHSQGLLTTSTRQNGLNMLNFARYLAGLTPATFDAAYNDQCQAGALALEASLQFSNNPQNLFNVNTALFNKGAAACVSSLLMDGVGSGETALMAVMSLHLDGISDGEALEARRKLLNPAMGKTGFGLVNQTSLIYADDTSAESGAPDFVAWPSPGYFPVERFQNPDFSQGLVWSVSLDAARYSKAYSDEITVTMLNKLTNQTTVFQAGMNHMDGSVFAVDKSPYGMDYSVSFRPASSAIHIGDQFLVTVSGLKGQTGQSLPDITYDTAFFSVFNAEAIPAMYDVTVETDCIRVEKGTPVTYTVTVKDRNEQALAGIAVAAELTGTMMNFQTDENGQALFTITPAAPYQLRIFVLSQAIGSYYYRTYQGASRTVVPYVRGDINLDCIVNAEDLVRGKKILLGLYTPTQEEELVLNITGDSGFSVTDLVTLKKIIADNAMAW